MSTSSLLPVEIWQTILRYAISVPDFLDSDAFEGVLTRRIETSSLNNESAYWSAENTRNRLRRVSKSWDTYLRPFEHRFVRMLDIRHWKIGPAALTKAIRISFGGYSCECLYCGHQVTGGASFWNIVGGVERMEVQIADMIGEQFLVEKLIRNSSKLQQVKTLIAPRCAYNSSFSQLVGRLPNLRNFYGRGFRGTVEIACGGGFISRSLVTLSFDLRKNGDYDTLQWNLPSLRYLRIGAIRCTPREGFVKSAVLHLLRAVGHQLRNFHLYYLPETTELALSELWDTCPNLERFGTSLPLLSPPPCSHPVHTLAVHYETQLADFTPPPEWPNLRRIVVDHSWGGADDALWNSIDLVQRNSVRIEDMGGSTWAEFNSGRDT